MQALARKKENVFLIRSTVGDNFAWYYVLADGMKKPILESKVGKEALDINDYGQILYSGWGENPPEEITRKIEEEFGS